MGTLKLTILGNGGCLNNGLPHNAFLINRDFLVEAPPDIMLSVKSLGLDIGDINTLFISHLHGDHTFGLPFIIINRWLGAEEDSLVKGLTVFGPEGIEEHAKILTERAFTAKHPCYHWLERRVSFELISVDSAIPFNSLKISCFLLNHSLETYGMLISSGDESVFAYVADTRWCQSVEDLLMKKPKVVFMDMNGREESDAHISLKEVHDKALPLTGKDVLYYGVHLADAFEPSSQLVKCAMQGDEINIHY